MTDSVQVNRTREIESLSNLYFIHPISRRFVSVFARLGISPNTVSALGIIFGIVAAWSYFHFSQWQYCVAGFSAMIMWHVMDGADGQLARLTGKSSDFGRVMDGLCDHVTVTLVYLSLAVAGSLDLGVWVFFAAVAAGASHLVQSSSYEFQRQMYDYWVYGKQSARFVTIDELRLQMESRTGVARIFARFYLVYLKIQRKFCALDDELFEQLDALRVEGDPAYSRARDLYRSVNVTAMKRWSAMSNNPRTVAIFITCIWGFPALYFVLEFTVMNGLFLAILRMQKRKYAALKSRLAEIGARTAATVVEVE